MGVKNYFKRYEQKYLLDENQYKFIREALESRTVSDEYGRSIISNIYFDTPDFRLIRRSLEKPVYKEKLRLRSYGVPKDETTVFLELKKKYNSVVYKRRESMHLDKAIEFIEDVKPYSQVTEEISYFMSFYDNLEARVALSYLREALYSKDDKELRITFDKDILWRTEDLDLRNGIYGSPILKKGETLMEIKTAQAIPLWLSDILTKAHAFKTSFSKYGHAYLEMQKQTKVIA